MAKTSLNLDRQADAKIFSFGGTGAGTDALVTVNKGSAAASTVVLDVKGSQNIGGDLNLTGNLNITGSINETSVTNLAVTDVTITVNKGGTTPADNTAGLIVEGTSAAIVAALYFDSASATKWSLATGGNLVGTTATQTLTNKSISGAQITSAVANATLAATVTTNANLTGPITSVGNATSIASQTGTGTKFVMDTSPTLVTPVIGAATGTSLAISGALTTGTASSADGVITWQNAASAFTQSFKGTNPGANITYLLPTTAPVSGQVLQATTPSAGVSTMSWVAVGTGSVTSVSVTTANGVSGAVATATTTPAITITLGAITPTSVAASGTVTGSNLSGTNTGDQVLPVGANPSANVGLSVVNGVATSFMRSDAAPALSQSITPIWTGLHIHRQAGITTSTDAVVLDNNTAATVGVQELSPRLRFTGQGWKTNATAGSQTVDWWMENRPIQGAASPSTNFAFVSQINAGGGVDQFVIKSDGSGTFTGTVTASSIIKAGGTSAQFLKADGSVDSSTYSTAVGANPSVNVTLSVQNGVATTFMRSDAAPALSQAIVPTWTGIHTHTQNGIASTSTDAVVLANTTAATVGVQQFSPRERLVGQGWKTNATAASQQVEWFFENRPVQGAANPTTNLAFASIINGGAAVDQFILTSAGSGTFTGALAASNLSGTNTGDQTSVSGNSGSTTLTAITDDTTTNATEFITWVSTASGNQAQKVSSTKLTFNPSTGILSATSFTGAGTGLTGTASSLTAGTVTTNANLTGMVTSVGNATTVVTNANLTGDVTSSGNATTLAKYHRAATVTGTQDGSNKVFTIGAAVKTGSDQVFVNGQLLKSGSSNDYVYDGATTVTFQAAFTAPAATDVIQIFGTF